MFMGMYKRKYRTAEYEYKRNSKNAIKIIMEKQKLQDEEAEYEGQQCEKQYC